MDTKAHLILIAALLVAMLVGLNELLTWRYPPNIVEISVSTAPTVEDVPRVCKPGQLEIRAIAPFPEIQDWSTLVISLKRRACYGPCPIYDVDIAADGTVTYIGHKYVKVLGERKSKITVDAVHALYDQFKAINFFSFCDKYETDISDAATYETTISFDGNKKTVSNYGSAGGDALRNLEDTIDRAAKTERWTGNAPSE